MNVIFLVSGEGGLFQTTITASKTGLLHADVIGAIADRACRSLERAKQHCKVAEIIDYNSCQSKTDFQSRLLSRLHYWQPDCIFMTFDRLVSHDIVKAFDGKILNMHPALLPAF